MYIGLRVKYQLFLSDFNKTSIFRKVFEKYSKPNFIKIHSMGAALFHADRREERQTDMKLMAAFFKFANAPERAKQNKGEGCEKINEIMK
jgi:hypothetical protein